LTVCLTHVSSVLGHLVGAEFIQRKFAGDSKQKAEDIIVSIVDAFKHRLKTIPWMDKESSDKAIEKVS
jgi:endothelin-converting enzyme